MENKNNTDLKQPEMIDVNKKVCVTCHYHIWFDGGCACYYYIMTNNHRNCPLNKCDKYKPLDENIKKEWYRNQKMGNLDNLAMISFKNGRKIRNG